MVKVIYQILHTKKNRSRKNGGKAGKAVYGITMENLRNRIDL